MSNAMVHLEGAGNVDSQIRYGDGVLYIQSHGIINMVSTWPKTQVFLYITLNFPHIKLGQNKGFFTVI